MSYLPGKFNWFEHLSNSPAQASEFHRALFGWTFRPLHRDGRPYQLIHNGDTAIGAMLEAPSGTRCHWNGFVSVSDVDATLRDAVAAGARSVLPAADRDDGRAATLSDPHRGPAVTLARHRRRSAGRGRHRGRRLVLE
jgi:predicted enzyme related to lactoylglutathione lyase